MAEKSLDDYDFTKGEAGASHTFPKEAGQIKKGEFIMIKDRPCKVVNVSTSKTGKHGHAKCNFTALDIFNNKKVEDVIPSTHTTSVPHVSRGEFTLIDISDDNYITLMDESGDTRDDLKLPTFPDDLGPQIRTAFGDGKDLILTVLSACGIEQVIQFKEAQQTGN